MQSETILELTIDHSQKGTYFTLPFDMPPETETLTLRYQYRRHDERSSQVENGSFEARNEESIIDLGLIAPDGTQVGASGSDKNEIIIGPTNATPGYKPFPLVPGQWQIIVGAYKVAPAGVTVTYTLSFQKQHIRLLRGDLHTHTLASDGVLTVQELGQHAIRHGLDFLAVTDHNQFVSLDALPHLSGLTFIPGVEWTHYQGHANFLGCEKPYDEPFIAHTHDEVLARFTSARSRGALITINHPFEEGYGFQFDIDTLPFDCLEVWNGPMRESNLRAVDLWQSMLRAGKKIPICGGSDYHRDSPFQMLGGPATCVYAASPSPGDILAALKSGHAFITFSPNGPTLEMTAGEASLGETVAWSPAAELQISASGLQSGDIIRVITANDSEVLLEAPVKGNYRAVHAVKRPGFARVEILRSFLSGLPMLPALISNPIYFDD